MNVIEINSENYKDYLHLDIIAFSFAGEGAQGEGGGLWMVTSDGKLYHTNFAGFVMFTVVIVFALPSRHATAIYSVPRHLKVGNHTIWEVAISLLLRIHILRCFLS